ncbi:hypothetical protein D6821_02760 [Candidatus Parcubacteria bacterium]|nr:MAG: hypothetical protein D6821_02760 [Candidatus Parcubacteria bacterium]
MNLNPERNKEIIAQLNNARQLEEASIRHYRHLSSFLTDPHELETFLRFIEEKRQRIVQIDQVIKLLDIQN